MTKIADTRPAAPDQDMGPERAGAPRSLDEARFRRHLHEFLTEHLIDVSQVFNGDLQQMLILAVLGRMHLRARISGAWAPPAPPPSISASRVAELTAIPRQTVRRKLLDMKAKGWLVQDQHHAWQLVVRNGRSNAHVSLGDIDARGINRSIRLARLLHSSG